MHSIFGYVITGQTVINTNDKRQSTTCNLLAYDSSIDKVIKSFWETENISCDLPKNPEDVYVEQKFSKEHSRDSKGRYVVYELNTLTYGIASSPYLSIKVLHQLADDSMKKYPTAATVLKRGFFVDNLLWSVETVEEAIQLQDKLIALLRSGGFELHKWASNCMPLLERMPGKLREMPVAFDDDKDLSIKVLGLQWLPLEDVFSFATLPASSANTKRGVLSQIGRQFDPLGFVAPCIFYAKCFMQKLWMLKLKLWLLKLGWDDQLPPHLSKEWHAYTSELHLLSNFKHERQVTAKQFSYHQILGFCDASTLGYAAVIYLRSSNGSGDVKVSLLLAKSKVVPLKTVSIPRLELLAAHLLAKLVKYTKSLLRDGLTIHDTYLFSDSSVVLAWLNTPCYHLKTFVATRVSKILDSVNPDCWFHINGACNPSDICSRGALPSTLLTMPEWLTGASWMYSPQTDWTIKSHSDFISGDLPELKLHSNVALIQSCQTDSKADSRGYIYDLSEKYSSFTKLQRVLAKCIQFFHIASPPNLVQKQRWLSKCRDLNQDELLLIHSNAPPLHWQLGRMTKVYPGPDGSVRVIKVRTRSGEFAGPVVKLSPLPVWSDSDSQ
nr:unnamed protein product [Callosobruchus analis]